MTVNKRQIMQMDWDSEVTFSVKGDMIHADITSDAFATMDDYLDAAEDYLAWYVRKNVDLIEDEAVKEAVRNYQPSEDTDRDNAMWISFCILRRDGTWVRPRQPVKEPPDIIEQVIEAGRIRAARMTLAERLADDQAWSEVHQTRLKNGEVILLSHFMPTERLPPPAA